jgi:hypothetical protein
LGLLRCQALSKPFTVSGGEMKILVAVKTCHRLDYWIDDSTIDWLDQRGLRHTNQPERVAAIRDTWVLGLKDIPYKFFYGSKLRSNPERRVNPSLNVLRDPLADEVFLPCSDQYTANSQKVKEICKWALAHAYDYLCLVDDDTFIYPNRLFATDFTDHDYSGGGQGSFAPGSCILLSARAMGILISAQITSFADDLWIGDAMTTNHVDRHIIDSIRHGFNDEYRATLADAKYAAIHSCTPKLMEGLWTLNRMSSQEQPKVTDGQVSKTTPSPLVSPVSEDVKSFLYATSLTLPGTPSGG